MNAEAADFIYRPYCEEDIPFLQSSWASSYFSGSLAKHSVSPEVFHSYHRPLRDRFFAKPTATVIVCTLSNDPWFILGWIAVEQVPGAMVLQYIYVRSSAKKNGIARQLIKRALPTSPVLFTHMTERASRIMSAKYKDLKQFKHLPHLV